MEAATALTLPVQPGTYALALLLHTDTSCIVGALGSREFPAGGYVYVGSAWGPGGLAARVGRHLRHNDIQYWHIDYLREHTTLFSLWLAPNTHLECKWAAYLLSHPDARVIVPRFGASDCKCKTHLVYFPSEELAYLALPGGMMIQ
ncbi:MAG: GIY-YIG nuclease family protein [Anaerolineae bacterium]|nr:GIY-YIG nuclease family protein [Anaerolineae bacterium]